MEVISISSDSEESISGDTVTNSPCQPQCSNWDEIYNVDWNDEAYPAIDYAMDPSLNETKEKLKPEEDIEDFVTPVKPTAKVADEEYEIDIDKSVNEVYNINDCSYSVDNPTQTSNNDKGNENFLTNNTKQNKQKLNQEEKERAKLLKAQKKFEREKTKEEKKAEQIRQKAYKAALTENQKNLKPEENIKFLKVHIDNEIVNSVFGGNIISLLQQSNIQYVVEPQVKSSTITWSKKKTIKVVNELGNLEEEVDIKDEEQMLYVLDWQKIVQLVHSNELLSHIETIKSVYFGRKITVIIFGLGKYFEYKRQKKSHLMKGDGNERRKWKPKPSENVFESVPNISKDQLEFALTDLQLLGKHNHRLLETPEELSSLVLNFTKSLSQIDYKLEKQKRQEEDLGWFGKGESGQCVKVDKNGNGLLKLWQQQICQFSTVGLETAQAVVSHYNSPLSLMNQYEKCSSTAEGELLLQNIQIRRDAGILSSTRRVGPQLSKKIYKFFTSEDPDVEL